MKKVTKSILFIMVFLLISLMNLSFAEASSANIPIVVQGLTPIKYVGNTWTDTSNMDEAWYDYENGEWANARTANGVKYVWIPRFTYKINNDNTISIKWSDGKVDDTDDDYLRHPAFYFGEYLGGNTLDDSNFVERNGKRNELNGFWIQKELFNTSKKASDAFDEALKVTSDSNYGLPQSGTYSHMTKASEWGALAYLAAAKGSITGGITTVNQTGVKIGNVTEYVVGVKGNPAEAYDILNYNSEKYVDKLNSNEENFYKGYALDETGSLATNSYALTENSFLIRGGDLGFFGFSSSQGTEKMGFRTSISILTEELTDTIAFFDTEASVMAGEYLILGVDFYVEAGGWKFPEMPENFFNELQGLNNKKVVDIECIYDGDSIWHQRELNATVIKMITPSLEVLKVEDIDNNEVYPDGKYTLVVRVGGKIGNEPVFKAMADMDTKIIVNELNLKDTSGDLIKIGNIPNNKVRLNVFGESGSSSVDKVILKQRPTKEDYALEEEIDKDDLAGGIIVPYLGNLAGEEMSIKPEYIKNKDVTSTPGNGKLVELEYKGVTVTQEDVKFLINVSNARQLIVKGEVYASTGDLNSKLLRGPGEYYREDADVPQALVAYEFLSGHMFSGWDSNSTYIKANSNNYETTFTIPKKSTTIDRDEVTITAKYVAPSRLEVVSPKVEFVVNENFALYPGKLFAVYHKDGSEVKKEISLGTQGVEVSIKDMNGNEHNLDKLQIGKYDVTIEYAYRSVTYRIEVVNYKYALVVYSNSLDYGDVDGNIVDQSGVEKDTIDLTIETAGVFKEVSAGNTVNLIAVPKEGYFLSKWKVTGKDDLLSSEDLTKTEISFTMPDHEIRIDAEFSRIHTVKFKIKQGQEAYGKLNGLTEQKVFLGKATSPVTATANDGYIFNEWVDSKGSLYTTTAQIINSFVEKDEEYTAVFESVWTVYFYNDDVLFAKVKVRNGEGAQAPGTPEKYGYVFNGWKCDQDKDLSNVTSDVVARAQYIPRINIEENPNVTLGNIDAQITGTMIEPGTLMYMISSSPDNPEGIYTTYELDDIFTGFDGNWYNLEGVYRNETIEKNKDSSALLTISSTSETETVRFDYILSSSADSQLGITINGEKVVTPSEYSGTNWRSFEKEVPVVDGKIKVGISYSQGNTYKSTDFAAIRNLSVSRQWTVITNDYHLLVPTEFDVNYIHVKGTGSDDLTTIYRAVSEGFYETEESSLETYIITYDANGGEGAPASQVKTKGRFLTLRDTEPTRQGIEFLGWATARTAMEPEYLPGDIYISDKEATLYAVWGIPSPTLAANSTWYTQGGTTIAKSSITSIDIKSTYTPGIVDATWDASAGKVGTIRVYVEDDGLGGDTYKLTIVGNGSGKIMANADSSSLFSSFSNLKQINGLDMLDTSEVTNMYCMFYNCSSLESLDVSGFNTSNVTNMRSMFNGCSSLTTIDVSSLDTSKVETMHAMFYMCGGLKSINFGEDKFNTSNVLEMGTMFRECSNLVSLDLRRFNTSKVTHMSHMFYKCSNLASITFDKVKFNTSNVTNMSSMFGECSSLATIDISEFTTSAATNTSYMFYKCSNLANITFNKDKFTTSAVTDMSCMFYECRSLTNLDISGFNTVNVTNMLGMFYDCSNLVNLTFDKVKFNTSNVTNMRSMFNKCSSLASLDVSGFNTSKVTDMSYMFNECSRLTTIDVSGFETSAVTNMEYMFYGCNNLTSINVNGFITNNVTSMRAMFANCNNLTSINVSGFVTNKVTNMRLMFSGCKALTELDVSKFTTNNVTTMYGMFNECQMLTKLEVTGFNTSKVTDMNNMFTGCMRLTSIDVSNFDTSKVTTMAQMFRRCNSLTSLDVSNFNTSSIKLSEITTESGGDLWIGLAGFAYDCPQLTTIILGETFGQEGNVPVAGSELGMFYVRTSTSTTVAGANSVMQGYKWGTDNRTKVAN